MKPSVGVELAQEVKLISVITCPYCENKKEAVMPIDVCLFFYGCENCKNYYLVLIHRERLLKCKSEDIQSCYHDQV